MPKRKLIRDSDNVKYDEPFEDLFPVKLKDRDRLDYAQQLVEVDAAMQKIEIEKAASAQEFKDRTGTQRLKQMKAMEALRTGEHQKPFHVREVWNFTSGRTWTEYVEGETPVPDTERDILDWERQERLGMGDQEAEELADAASDQEIATDNKTAAAGD